MADAHAAELSPEEAHDVLERFVVDNDELLELEEQIGRFNIFDALGVARAEIRHSNFLSWLLDPNESHGQGALFLKAILMDLLKKAPSSMRPLSPVELDGEELRGVEVRREWKKVDLLITCKEPPFVIAVENKIDSGESEGQLEKYKSIVHEHFSELKPMFVFLTTDSSEPSDEEWVPYSYKDIHRVLKRVRRTGAGAIGDDVEAFLEHYLRLIGSRFMDDRKIDELCQRIYKNHRQAIALINERVGSGLQQLIRQIANLAQEEGKWNVLSQGSTILYLIPKSWNGLAEDLKKITNIKKRSLTGYVQVVTSNNKSRCTAAIEIGPIGRPLRQKFIDRLTSDQKEFGLALASREKASTQYTRLVSKSLRAWPAGNDPPIEECVEAFNEWSNNLLPRLARVPDALRPIIEEWEASR